MATKSTKKVAKASTKKVAKAPAKAAPKKTGTIRDQFGLREGTNRATLVDMLLAAKGKPVAVSTILKTLYGRVNEDDRAGLAMIVQGARGMIEKNKIKMEIIRETDEKLGATIALKSK